MHQDSEGLKSLYVIFSANMCQPTCANQHVPTNMFQPTCSNQHVSTNMGQPTCTNMYQPTCTNQHVPTNMYQPNQPTCTGTPTWTVRHEATLSDDAPSQPARGSGCPLSTLSQTHHCPHFCGPPPHPARCPSTASMLSGCPGA